MESPQSLIQKCKVKLTDLGLSRDLSFAVLQADYRLAGAFSDMAPESLD